MVLAKPPLKPDYREDTTAWKALQWAYADECVRMATNSDARFANTGYSAVTYTDSASLRGAINGFLEAHDDALIIDAKVRAWFDQNGTNYHRVALAAERRLLKGRPVPRACDLPGLKAVPVRRVNGTIKEEYRKIGRHDEPCYCLVEYEGHTADELRQVQELHDLFIALLDIMPGLKLSKWRIIDRGLDSSGRIIDKALKPVTG